MKIHADSHVDHSLTKEQIAHILQVFALRTEGFKETITLPKQLGTAPNALYGPKCGDDPVGEDEVYWERRGNRPTVSRMVNRPLRQSRQVTVIAGFHPDDHDAGLILYTAFGGPGGEREPDDPGITSAEEKLKAVEFWSEHALTEWRAPRYHHYVLSGKGPASHATVAIIPVGGEMVAVGVSFCSARDQWSKKKGRLIAEGRARDAGIRQAHSKSFRPASIVMPEGAAQIAVKMLRSWFGDKNRNTEATVHANAEAVCDLLEVNWPGASGRFL